ncbi:MAG: 1-acyl-sn-glycerol-3-phosphate acyltransferase [Anaerolineales bacterium]|nr:1-acyl-sn-glycerol-3-phosphate acyltransferase [Anaerolineales bacterium]
MSDRILEERELNQKLLEEIFKALGWGRRHPLRLPFAPLFSGVGRRFVRIALRFDQDVAEHGFREAARRLLPHFVRQIEASGVEQIPTEGPLLIVSNHPGTVDGVAIAAHLPRSDLKIVVSGVPFIRHLRATARHLIYSSLDAFERMKVVRESIRHLEEGGAVLLFPSGGLDPDPAVMPGALQALEEWSPSLEVILRRVPAARVLITFVSGVLHPAWARSPVIYLRRGRRNQQRVAEFFQVMEQLLFPRRLLLRPSLWFAPPIQFTSQETPTLLHLITAAKAHFRRCQEKEF